jgi:uncharacterized membrane protein
MRLLPVIGAIALASVLMCAHPASAFTIYSGGGSGGSSRYADPDNQFRSYFGLGGGSEHDRSYDRGTLPAQSVIVNQGVLAPDWFFGRPRR